METLPTWRQWVGLSQAQRSLREPQWEVQRGQTSTFDVSGGERFQASIIPSRTVRQTFSTRGSDCTSLLNATMARVSSSSGSMTLPLHKTLSPTIRPPGFTNGKHD